MPSDPSKLARRIIDLATGENAQKESGEDKNDAKDPAAVSLGRKGGKKGGKARAKNMTAEERSEAARKAAKARWKREKDEEA